MCCNVPMDLMALCYTCVPVAGVTGVFHVLGPVPDHDIWHQVICNTSHCHEQQLAIVSCGVVLSDEFSSELVSGSRILLQVMAELIQQHLTGGMSTGIRRLEKRLKESLPEMRSPVPLKLGLQPVSNHTCSSQHTGHFRPVDTRNSTVERQYDCCSTGLSLAASCSCNSVTQSLLLIISKLHHMWRTLSIDCFLNLHVVTKK